MMRKVKNIAAIIMMLTFLTANVGISISHHICNMSGQHSTAFFANATCEHSEETTCDSCCEQEQTSSDGCIIEEHSHCLEFVEYLAMEEMFIPSSQFEIETIDNIIDILPIIAVAQNNDNHQEDKRIELPDIIPIQAAVNHVHLMSQSKDNDYIS